MYIFSQCSVGMESNLLECFVQDKLILGKKPRLAFENQIKIDEMM